MRLSENPRSLWEPILDFAVDKEHWVETFLDNWFAYGLGSPEVPDGFRQQWADMLDYGFASERWNPKQSGSRYGILDLWTRLMGLYVSDRGSFLWTEDKGCLVAHMRGYLERWCDAFLRYGHCAERYAAFLAEPAAVQIRVASLVWLGTGAEGASPHWWNEHRLADSLAHLLVVVWEGQQMELKQNQPAFAAFRRFLSRLAAQLNPIALELESRV